MSKIKFFYSQKIKDKILEQLTQTMIEYSIAPEKWKLNELTLDDDMGHGYARYLHIEDVSKHMTSQRSMEFQGFFFEEKTGEMIQGNYPTFG